MKDFFQPGAFIVLPSGQRFAVHALSVEHRVDSLDVTCLGDSRSRFAVMPCRTTVVAEVSGFEEATEVVKCGGCGHNEHKVRGVPTTCSYCRSAL